MLTVEQEDLLGELSRRGTATMLEGAVPGINLSFFQANTLAAQLITKGLVVSLDTGLGKTYVAMAYVWLTLQRNKNERFIFVSTKDAVVNNYNKFNRVLPGVKCEYVTGEKSSKDALSYLKNNKPDVLFLTQKAVIDREVLLWLYDNKEYYRHLIVDEIHTAIYEESSVFQSLRGIRSKMDSILAMTATPLRVSPRQFINILHIVDEELIPNPNKLFNQFAVYDDNGKVTGFHDVEAFEEYIVGRYLSYTRKDLGYENTGSVGLCVGEISKSQQDLLNNEHITKIKRRNLARICDDNPMADKLCGIVKTYSHKGKKGLIYANVGETKDYLNRKLRSEGIRCEILDGRVSKDNRQLLQDLFNQDNLDCLIINITTSLDLNCDYIIFYELTSDFEQTLGRGQRGLTQREVDVWFCVFRHLLDYNFYLDNIYKNGLLLKEFGGKEVAEVLSGYDSLRKEMPDM